MLLPRHAVGRARVDCSCPARCEHSRVLAGMRCRLWRHCSPTGPKRVQRKFVTRKEQTLTCSHGPRVARMKPRLRECAADAWRCQPSARRVQVYSRRSRTCRPVGWSETGAALVDGLIGWRRMLAALIASSEAWLPTTHPRQLHERAAVRASVSPRPEPPVVVLRDSSRRTKASKT